MDFEYTGSETRRRWCPGRGDWSVGRRSGPSTVPHERLYFRLRSMQAMQTAFGGYSAQMPHKA